MAACNCQLQKFVANGNPRRGGARTATFASELCASLQRAQPDAVFCSRATLTGRLRPQLLRHCLDVCSSPLCSSDVRSSFGKAGLGTGGTGDSVTQFYPVSFPSRCSTIKVVRRTAIDSNQRLRRPRRRCWPADEDDGTSRQPTSQVAAARHARSPGQRSAHPMRVVPRRGRARAARADERKVRDPSSRPGKILGERNSPSAVPTGRDRRRKGLPAEIRR